MLRRQPFEKIPLFFFPLMLGMVALLLFTVWRNSRETTLPGDPQHQLSRTLVAQLYEEASILSTIDGLEHLYISCTSVEGRFCYVIPGHSVREFYYKDNAEIHTDTNRLKDELASDLLMELDTNPVERAKNNTVLLHCRRYTDGTFYCTLNGGGEKWYPVRLTS